MTISTELLDDLLSGVERPEDLLGDKGLMKELKVPHCRPSPFEKAARCMNGRSDGLRRSTVSAPVWPVWAETHTHPSTRNASHAAIISRRFSSMSPRRYARSPSEPMKCARPISAVSRRYGEISTAQVRNVARRLDRRSANPLSYCSRAASCIRFIIADSVILLSIPPRVVVNTSGEPSNCGTF